MGLNTDGSPTDPDPAQGVTEKREPKDWGTFPPRWLALPVVVVLLLLCLWLIELLFFDSGTSVGSPWMPGRSVTVVLDGPAGMPVAVDEGAGGLGSSST